MTSSARPAGEPNTEPYVLEATDLTVRFTTESGTVLAVDGVDLRIEPGEIVGIVGESGCGKSVTAMALSGLVPRSAKVSGEASLLGRRLIGASGSQLRDMRGNDIAYIFQEPMNSLNPVLTVGRQIVEAIRRHRQVTRAEAKDRAIDLLKLVRIPSAETRFKQYPHQLSGGMRQRVMIAMALACEPKLLVADEPTTALDVTVQAGILDVLRDLRGRLDTSILVITHDLGVIADIADRVIVMYAGRIVEEAPLEAIFAAPRHRYLVGLLGASPMVGVHSSHSRLKEIPGLVPVMSESADRCTFAPRCAFADQTCHTQRPPLAPAPGSPAEGGRRHVSACWHPQERAEAAERFEQVDDSREVAS